MDPAFELRSQDEEGEQQAEREQLEGVAGAFHILARFAVPGVVVAFRKDAGRDAVDIVHPVANGLAGCQPGLEGDRAEPVEVREFLGGDGFLLRHHVGKLDQ